MGLAKILEHSPRHWAGCFSFKEEKEILVLTRKQGESINIGDNVTITILANDGNQVRIGIDAPKEVAVHRSVFYQRIQATEVNGNR